MREYDNLLQRALVRTGKVGKNLLYALLIGMMITLQACDTADAHITDPTHQTDQNKNNNNENNNQSDNKYAEYSPLYQYFLKECNGLACYNININTTRKKNIPYTFLAKQGYDRTELEKGTIKSECTSCIFDDAPNDLYMFVRVIQDKYYDMFVVKYNLSDQEVLEYNKIYPKESYTNPGFLYNDAISAYKDETLISHIKMSKDALDLMTNKGPLGTMIVAGFDPDSRIAKVYSYRQVKGDTEVLVNEIKFNSINALKFSYSNNTITCIPFFDDFSGMSFTSNTHTSIPANTYNYQGAYQHYQPIDYDILDKLD